MTLSIALASRVWWINPVFTYIQICFLKACVLNAKMTSREKWKLVCVMLELPSTTIATYCLRWVNSQQRKTKQQHQHSLHSNHTADDLGQN